LSPDQSVARRYASSTQNVMPFFVRGKLLKVDRDNPIPEWLSKSSDYAETLKARGYSGLEVGGKLPEVVVYDPSDIMAARPPRPLSPDTPRYTAQPASWDKTGKSWVIMDAETGIDTGGVMSKSQAEDTVRILQKKQAATASAAEGAGAKASRALPTVDLINSRRLLNGVVKDLGNDVSKLTPLEKELLEMSSPGRNLPVTYTALMRMKADVGQALQRSAGPYKDVDSAILKRLYGALSEDQLAHAQKVGGDTLRADLRLGNQLVAKRKALEDRIVSLFGDERDGSIARKLVSTLQGGAKGDITGFNRLVKSIPADLRKKAVATAIAAASREAKTDGFGFAKYVTLYQGLRDNSEVYKTVVQTLGPDSDKFLRDLYEISKRITEARAQVLTTGKANQALVQGMTAEGLVQGVLRNTVGKKTVMGVPIAGQMVEALTKSSKNKLDAAGDLFASPEWQQLVINVSTKQQVNQKIYNAAKNSAAFKKWAREAGITDPEQWLRSTISSTIGMGAAEKTQPYQSGMGRPE